MRPASLLPRVRLHRPGFDVLTILCVVLVVVQGVVALLGSPYELEDGRQVLRGYFEALALSRAGLLEGKVWQVGTHVFLHGGWSHLVVNWLVIYLIGGRIFEILGGRGFGKVFGAGVLAGSILHLLLHPGAPLGVEGEVLNAPLVGASGGGMALLVALTGLSPDSRMWPIPVSGRNLGRGLLLASLLLYLVTPGVGIPGLRLVGAYAVEHGLAGMFQFGHIYHFGGGLAGWLYAKRVMGRPVTLDELRDKRAKREGVAA